MRMLRAATQGKYKVAIRIASDGYPWFYGAWAGKVFRQYDEDRFQMIPLTREMYLFNDWTPADEAALAGFRLGSNLSLILPDGPTKKVNIVRKE
jgi:hypothetical protein